MPHAPCLTSFTLLVRVVLVAVAGSDGSWWLFTWFVMSLITVDGQGTSGRHMAAGDIVVWRPSESVVPISQDGPRFGSQCLSLPSQFPLCHTCRLRDMRCAVWTPAARMIMRAVASPPQPNTSTGSVGIQTGKLTTPTTMAVPQGGAVRLLLVFLTSKTRLTSSVTTVAETMMTLELPTYCLLLTSTPVKASQSN
ncbi:uncharacterized protein LOC135111741 isoform X2 [Scylla paramamosain]|uniref:uncharacterized protein LOC135111741 isoform X2 n=1 Tax=Scylla paramamosain TaxID=85552 RepID=UPI0030827D59